LVDDLLAEDYANLSVLDLAGAALQAAKARLGDRANKVNWLEADITQVELPHQYFDVWHDRAVFHFLTQAEDREAYVHRMHQSLKPGGHIIISTFAEEGPIQCSGLPVVRYSPASLHAELGAQLKLKEHSIELHHTPFGSTQQFIYCHFIK
jgi:2-polyprenyl-3-methyl-5-hydroxy-6-metoxy-1,4-benzoquinol methylase